jgi:hypothetical protein
MEKIGLVQKKVRERRDELDEHLTSNSKKREGGMVGGLR